MELQKTTSRILFWFVLIVCLGGCETHLNSEPLELIGSPPKEMYYDTEFAYQFGVMGGDGLYDYEYIANPDDVPDGQLNARNPVELKIDELDENKPGFWLRGMPTIESDDDFLAVPERELEYELLVTDGASTIRRQYEFTLKKNALVLTTPLASTRERQVSNSQAKSLLSAREGGSKRACRQGVQSNYDSSYVNGRLVYPLVMGVSLKARPSRRVEIGYRFVSTYNESEAELSQLNLEKARPNVDYLDEERTLVFEPGETQCIIYLNVLDDNQVEGLERLEVHFFDRKGGKVDITGVVGQILITENEPVPKYTTRKVAANEGDTVITEFSVTQAYSLPIDVLVNVDMEKTTAERDDFLLEPLDGRVTIPAGATKASYTVKLLHNNDLDQEDDVVAIKTSLDERNNVEPMEISINKWKLANEIVGRQSDGREVIDFIYGNGRLFVLNKTMTLANEEAFSVSVYNGLGQIIDQPAMVLSQEGLDISPVAIGFDNNERVIVVANVNGRFAQQSHFGGNDFIVVSFSANEAGQYQRDLVRQFGTDGDDLVSGFMLGSDGGQSFIFGSTDGKEFDGLSGNDISQGGLDGFVYRVDTDLLTKQWAEFVGTTDSDGVTSVFVSSDNLIVQANSQNSDKDVFMRMLSVSDGDTQEFVIESGIGQVKSQVDISSPEYDSGVGVAFRSAGTSFLALVNSDANLPSFVPNPSSSRDVFLIAYDSESGVVSGTTKMATTLHDSASILSVLNVEADIAVGGITRGEFPDQTRKGVDNDDAFVAVISNTESGQTALSNVAQFGTRSNDNIIKINRINDYKFMVLWSEAATSGDGSKVYRLSPFSVDGTKLTPDP